jgi:UPF0755 protein
MKPFTIFKIIFILLILAGLGYGGFYLYSGAFATPSASPTGNYKLQIKTRETLSSLATKLQEDKIINNADFIPFISKISVSPNLKAGVYELNLPAKPDSILWQINNQKPSPPQNTVSVSFIEGDTVEDMAEKLEKSGVISSSDFLNYIQNPQNFDLEKYDFLPPVRKDCKYGEIYNNCPKYYLEGYLYPDTYNFYKDSKPEVVAAKFLKNFNLKYWQDNRNKYDKDPTVARNSLYQQIILASVVEREVGRNYIKAMINDADLNQERRQVARVYLNRTEKKMKWQSDPTVWYGVDRKKGVGLDGELNWGNSKYKTGYNTYVIDSYPVGPITSPSLDSLQATLNPETNDYLFFVSDKSGKMYFGKTNAEHNQNITKVREINKTLPNI